MVRQKHEWRSCDPTPSFAGVPVLAANALASGFAFGLSLIVAIGPQNAFVMRQGALRHHVGLVVLICAASDVVLIAAGVSGAGAALAGRHWLLEVTRLGGAAVLLVYALMASRRARRPAVDARVGASRSTRAGAVAACLAFTWLNPAVYLDTVVLLGSVAQSHPGRQWWFGGGAALGSVLWFGVLAAAAASAHTILTRPRVWRGVDWFVAAVMTVTAARMVLAP